MTWAEFKKQMEEAGVEDRDEIWYIDVGMQDKINVVRKEADEFPHASHVEVTG